MTKGEQKIYREAAECKATIVQALKVLRDKYARGELVYGIPANVLYPKLP